MQEIRLWTKEQIHAAELIPKRDALAFVRIERMLQQGLPLILSDGADCLLVQSDPRSPAWVWTSNGIPDETLGALLLSLGALREQGRLPSLVAKGRFARLFALAFDGQIERQQRLNVYRMAALTECRVEGCCVPGSAVSYEVAGELIAALAASDGEALSPQEQRDMGIAFTESDGAFAWQTPAGEIASIAKAAPVGSGYTDIHTVYTREDLRNRGYAKALLCTICSSVLEQGQIPMLYADRDYAPSNAAYRAVGFSEHAHLSVLRLR